MRDFDVLCVGHACYDLIFAVDHHPAADEKARASAFINCGGGTAANAAMTAAMLGYRTAFAGYLGRDIYGDEHLAEFHGAGVDTALVVQGTASTPISAIFVKPNGDRSIVNYKGDTNGLTPADVDFRAVQAKVLLFDGHQPDLAVPMATWAREQGIATVLDADTVNEGNAQLVHLCDVVAASERFAQEFTGAATPEAGMVALAQHAPSVIVTLGERGLIWQRNTPAGPESGALPAFRVPVVDTTGAGDTFHGALAAGVAAGMAWKELLRFAAAAGALCCTKHGARLGIPTAAEVGALLQKDPG
ncbi:MAG: carbohydrate kinase [Caldilineaceae bacterium]|nr:carbohydrate kinase [Caldilineaceae bacterium]